MFQIVGTKGSFQGIVNIINVSSATHGEIARAGEFFFLSVYNVPASKTSKIFEPTSLPFFSNSLLVFENKSNLALLPPTAAATQQHSGTMYITKSSNGVVLKNLPNCGVGRKSRISFTLFRR